MNFCCKITINKEDSCAIIVLHIEQMLPEKDNCNK